MDFKSPYAQKLRDPRWQKTRLQVMERDEWTCRVCGDTKTTFNVHHMFYVKGREPWDYPLSSLITLCEVCHEAETNCMPISAAYLLHVLKTIGANSAAMDALSEVMPGEPLALASEFDDWSVFAHGVAELLSACRSGDPSWQQLRERYYERLRENKPAE